MNKYINKSLICISMLLGIISCKKNNIAVDQDPLVLPQVVHFAKNGPATDNFYIQSTPDGGSTFKIPIGITTIASQDRTIQFTYQSATAVAGAQYKAPQTLTIPAGKALDTLVIQGLYDGYTAAGRKDMLTIKIQGGGAVPVAAYNDSVVLYLQKYCSVNLNTLAGNYDNTNEYSSAGAFSYGPYTTVLKDVQLLTPTTGKGKIENIYDEGWNDLEVKFDWSDPANFKVTMDLQNTGRTSGGFPVYVRSSAGRTNTFSSCEETFSLSIDRLGGATGTTVLTSGYQIRLAR